jgi:hypothetical protein
MSRIAVHADGLREGTLLRRTALLPLGLFVLAIWMVQHPYGGIEYNDSSLYALLALARLNPQSLSGDVFLRFGSQDQYTVFSPLFASVIRVLDLEPAAALLTLAGQIAFFGCAWLLARRVMPARLALVAVGLLVALPSSYGAANIFSYVESFLTPRQLTEALVLAALAGSATHRYVVMGVCMLAAMMLHPIMGFAGIVMLACLHVALPRPRLAAAVAAGLLLGSLVPILIIPRGVFAPFDANWFSLALQSTPYLLLSQWNLQDWGHLAGPSAALALGSLKSNTAVVRKLCCGALITGACGMAVTLIYCDVLHAVIFTQMQPWRWLWLAEAMAVLLLPVIALDCWRSGLSGRTAVVLLVGTWVLRDYPVVVLCDAFICVAWAATGGPREPRYARLVFLGSWALLAVALAINLAPKLAYVPINATYATHEPALNGQWLRVWGADGVIYSFVLALSWWMLEGQQRLLSALSMAAGGLACILLGPLMWQSWTAFHYTHALQTAFAPWRAAIPQRAQVIWPGTPVGTWYLLERPSYYSIHQVAGDIFSRPKAIEIHRRAGLIGSALLASRAPGAQELSATSKPPLPANADGLNASGIAIACSDAALQFAVSWRRLGPTPIAPIVPNDTQPRNQLHLYRCADVRGNLPSLPIGSRPAMRQR